jgi:hypothetical protein
MIYPENVQLLKLFLAKGAQVTLLKYGNGGYLAWGFQFWGRKRAYTLLNVYLITIHLVE